MGVSQFSGNVFNDINIISEEIRSNSSDENLYNKRALLYLQVGEYELALNDVEIGISLNKKSASLYRTQTLIYLKRKRFDSALESANKMISLDTNEPNLFLRSTVHFTRGEIREAIHDLNKILVLNPRADYVYLQKALWCNDLNMYYEEIRCYLYYIKISEDEINVKQIKKKINLIKKSDKYYRDLIQACKKEIRKNGYPWEYKVLNH